MKIVNTQQIYTLEFSGAQLAVLSEGLALVPFGRAAPVVAAIEQQLESTEAPKTDAELMSEHHGRYT